MTRGSPAEKAALVHGICDLDGGGTVSRKEVLITSMEISEVMNGSGFTSREYGDAEETVNNLFLKRIKTTSSGGKIDMTNHSGGHRHRHHGIGIHARRRGDSNNDDVGRDDSAAGAEAEAAENANDEDEPEFPDLYDNELGMYYISFYHFAEWNGSHGAYNRIEGVCSTRPTRVRFDHLLWAVRLLQRPHCEECTR
jgi:hypothetical protein